MNTNTLKGIWGVIKARLKDRYSNLTENDLAYIQGREEEVIHHIQEKTGASRDELTRYLRDECGCNC
jgi:uncharacterized protein YjbJ (UPF0337 family)